MKEENNYTSIPYIAYESVLARHERIVKKLIISIIFCVLLIVISNICWLYAWCQYDYESEDTSTTTTTSETIQQDGKGQNIYGDGNSINNGSDHNNNKDTNKTKTQETQTKKGR